MRTIILALFLGLLMISLSGCIKRIATANPHNTNIAYQQRKEAAQNIRRFALEGLIAITSSDDSLTANFDWHQKDNHYEIRLDGPIAAGSAILSGSPYKTLLMTADGKKAAAVSPEKLLQKILNIQLPVTPLKYWVRGIPAKGKSRFTLDHYNHLAELDQRGWHIQYLKYTAVGSYDLPSKIFLTRKNLQVKIFIHQWKLS